MDQVTVCIFSYICLLILQKAAKMGGCCGAMKSSHKSMPEKDKQPQSKSNTLTRNTESKVKTDKKAEANGKTPKKNQEEQVAEKQQESNNLAGDDKEVKLINPFESDEKIADNPVANGPSAVGVSAENEITSQESNVVSDDDIVVKAGEIVEETIRKSVQEECSSAKPVVTEAIEEEKQKDEATKAPVTEVTEEKIPTIVMETFPGDVEQKEDVEAPIVEVIEKEIITTVTETMPIDAAGEKEVPEAQESPKEQKTEDSKKVDEPVQESQPQIMTTESKEVENSLFENVVPELHPQPCQTNVLESGNVVVEKDEEKQEKPLLTETCESNDIEDVQVPKAEVSEPLAEVLNSETTEIIEEKVEAQQAQNSKPSDSSETQDMETGPQQQPVAQVSEKLAASGEKCCKLKEVEPITEETLQEKQAKISEEPVSQNVDEPKEHLPVEVKEVIPEPMMCVVEESNLGETEQLDIVQPCLLAPQCEEQVPAEKSETDQEMSEEKPIANTDDSNIQPEVVCETQEQVLVERSETENELSEEKPIANTNDSNIQHSDIEVVCETQEQVPADNSEKDVRQEEIPESLNETSRLAEAENKSQEPETAAVEELAEEMKAIKTLEVSSSCPSNTRQTPDIEKEDLVEVSQPETRNTPEQQVLQVETRAEEASLGAGLSSEVDHLVVPEASNEIPLTQHDETSKQVFEAENNVESKARVTVEGVEQYSNQLVEETVENVLGELTVSVCSEKDSKREEMNANSEETEVSEQEVPVEKCESSCGNDGVLEIKTTLESNATLPQEESQDDDGENLPPPPAPEELMFPQNVLQSEGSMPSSQDSLSLPSPPGDVNCENAIEGEPQIENHCPSVEAEVPCVELKSDITCECSATETKVKESLCEETSKSADNPELEPKKE